MNDKGDTRDDLRLPEGELGQKIRDEFAKDDNTVIVSFHIHHYFIFNQTFPFIIIKVTVMAAVDEEAIIACKNATN